MDVNSKYDQCMRSDVKALSMNNFNVVNDYAERVDAIDHFGASVVTDAMNSLTG